MTNKIGSYELSSLLKKEYIQFNINNKSSKSDEDVYSMSSEGLLDFISVLIRDKKQKDSLLILNLYKLIKEDIKYFEEINLKHSELLNLADINNKFIKQYGLMIKILKYINSIAVTKSTLTYFIYLFIYDKIDITIIKPINNKYYEYYLNDSIIYYIVFN